MLLKVLIIALLAAILVSLFSGLFFLHRDQEGSGRLARALTVRIVLSVLLFALLIGAYLAGLIEPHGIMGR